METREFPVDMTQAEYANTDHYIRSYKQWSCNRHLINQSKIYNKNDYLLVRVACRIDTRGAIEAPANDNFALFSHFPSLHFHTSLPYQQSCSFHVFLFYVNPIITSISITFSSPFLSSLSLSILLLLPVGLSMCDIPHLFFNLLITTFPIEFFLPFL